MRRTAWRAMWNRLARASIELSAEEVGFRGEWFGSAYIARGQERPLDSRTWFAVARYR